jgi:hypothetical protein
LHLQMLNRVENFWADKVNDLRPQLGPGL